MGKRKCVDKSDGSIRYNYEFRFTTNGETWITVLFEDLGDARDYGNQVTAENEENARFQCFARKFVQVDTCDFLDSCICADRIRIIDRHRDANEGR